MQVKIINKIPASAVKKKRVCAYARVSTDSRRQEDSLENQTATYSKTPFDYSKRGKIDLFAK